MHRFNSFEFYDTYHGHDIKYLEQLKTLADSDDKDIVYLAGDSSLDNKYWINFNAHNVAINGYEKILFPPIMKPDISYHMNKLLVKSNYFVINSAVEASTIASRQQSLLDQDIFIRNNIRNNDVLIVSVGGNDIALSPSVTTMWNMVLLMYLNSYDTLKNDILNAWGISHFIKLFKNAVKSYILKLIGPIRPQKVIVCTIYYPDEQTNNNSWADKSLGYLGYNSDPKKLQVAISQIFNYATSKIKISGVDVIPFPMFEVLDGKDSSDYVQRVEPSDQGGEKLASAFVEILKK